MLSPVTKDPICIYCGTSRPVADPRCPECGHPWIDVTIEEALAPQQPGQVGFAEVREIPILQPEPAPAPKRPWRLPLIITSAALAVYAIVFATLIARSGPEDPPTAAPSTTTLNDPAATAIGSGPSSAGPVPTRAAPAQTTLTLPPTTFVEITTPPAPTIPPVGDPIALEDLALGAFALGPLDFNDGDINALGRLVSTFGQPDEAYAIGEPDGLCPTESGTAARFGWLTALLRDEDGTDVLVGYRLEEPVEGGLGHPTAELKTISGAAIGDTIEEWNTIYRAFGGVIEQEIDGTPVLLLLRLSNERTLLWGPLTNDDPVLVTGVFSPRPCDGGPFRAS